MQKACIIQKIVVSLQCQRKRNINQLIFYTMNKNEITKKAENIVSVIKTLQFPTLCHYLYAIRKQTELVAAIAEFVGVKGETDHREIATAIAEYGKEYYHKLNNVSDFDTDAA